MGIEAPTTAVEAIVTGQLTFRDDYGIPNFKEYAMAMNPQGRQTQNAQQQGVPFPPAPAQQLMPAQPMELTMFQQQIVEFQMQVTALEKIMDRTCADPNEIARLGMQKLQEEGVRSVSYWEEFEFWI